VKRGEVWWIRFPNPTGRRPGVLVSRNEAYPIRGAVTVVPLTRTVRKLPVEVSLGPADGFPQPCVANADNITTVPKARVEAYLAMLSPLKLAALERAIKFSLDLP
jgi:mRNA-degrading endonuclease toxin of MazEF toxin-antitoxin module